MPLVHFRQTKSPTAAVSLATRGGEVGFPTVSVSDAPCWVEGFVSEELSISSRELVAGSVFTDYRITESF